MSEVGINKVKVDVPRDVPQEKIGKAKDNLKGTKVEKVFTPDHSKLKGKKISVRKGPGKLAKFGKGVVKGFKGLGKLIGGVIGLGVGLAGAAIITSAAIVRTALSLPIAAVKQGIEHLQGKQSGEKVFMESTPWVKDLKKPMKDSILRQDGLMDQMADYGKKIGSPLKSGQIKDLISTGERLYSAIKNGTLNKDGSIDVVVDGKTHKVKPNTYTTLAVSWYMMAKAGADGDSHLVERGALMLKDDDNKLYNFLTKSPTAYGRVSTHLKERSGSKIIGSGIGQVGIGGLLWKAAGKTPQRGIEDFQGRFPGQKSCILFDRTVDKNGQKGIYIKFESAGMPNVFRVSKSHGKHGDSYDSPLTKEMHKIKSFGRCFKHCTSFMKTIGEKLGIVKKHTANDAWVHRENVHKDVPKKMVFKPFEDVLGCLAETNFAPKDALKKMEKAGKKHGLHLIESMFANLVDDKGNISLPPTLALKKGVTPQQLMANLITLKDGIEKFRKQVGEDYGIQRKGNEIHVNVDNVATDKEAPKPQPKPNVDQPPIILIEPMLVVDDVDDVEDDFEVLTLANINAIEDDDEDWLNLDDDWDDIGDDDWEDLSNIVVQEQPKPKSKFDGLDPGLKKFLERTPGVRNQLDKFSVDDLSEVNKLFGKDTQLLAVNKAREIARSKFNQG